MVRIRFRLRTLMIVVAFVALVLVAVMQGVYRKRAEVRMQMYRAEAEHARAIADAERAHAIAEREVLLAEQRAAAHAVRKRLNVHPNAAGDESKRAPRENEKPQ
jgi:hypothetical protein